MKYTDKQIRLLIEAVYDGRITQGKLPKDLYLAIADYLKGGLYQGFGGSLIDYKGEPLNLLFELRENIYLFSGAKTYQTVGAMMSMLTDDGKLRPFKEFKDAARDEYNLYNKQWAQTEYDTAIASGQQAHQWERYQADIALFPYGQFTVVEDANTTPICKPLDNLILPMNHPFMSRFWPPNHFNCRTTVLQLSEGTVDHQTIRKATEHMEADTPKAFQMNCGKDKKVFSEAHPYFDVANKDKALAQRNFNLPIPKND